MTDKFVITSDNTCDLPQDFLEKNSVSIAYLGYSVDGKDYQGKGGPETAEFYKFMREGKTTKTAQINPEDGGALFEPFLQQGFHILHFAFSSGLSGTYSSMRLAAETLLEKYPESRIVVVDTLAASLGEGLIVYKALQLKAQGKSFDEIVEWAEKEKLHVCHYFTVDDLNFLYRGGRVSRTAAVMGTMLGIKPLLHVDDNGKLIPISKIRGRKQSLDKLVDYMEKSVGSYKNDIVFISHGDCITDAQYVADQIRKRFKIDQFIINYVDPIIGAHSGPGTVALFFFGENR